MSAEQAAIFCQVNVRHTVAVRIPALVVAKNLPGNGDGFTSIGRSVGRQLHAREAQFLILDQLRYTFNRGRKRRGFSNGIKGGMGEKSLLIFESRINSLVQAVDSMVRVSEQRFRTGKNGQHRWAMPSHLRQLG